MACKVQYPAVEERRPVSRQIAEALKEIGVLLAALYPLEAGVSGSFRWSTFIYVELAALVFLTIGIIVESGYWP